MFSLRTKLVLLFGLLITVVLVTWLYAQQSYSAFNLSVPDGDIPDIAQNQSTATAISTLMPTPSSPMTPILTATESNPDSTNCTYPLSYWQLNQDQIPSQILVYASADHENEVCVNYAESEICARLGETSITPDGILRQQFLVVIMNYLTGADPSVIANTINDAYEWLRIHASSASITDEDAQTAQHYAEILQSYNQGGIGPGACEVEILPLAQDNIPSSSPTAGSMATGTASVPIITSTPTARRTVVIVVPTTTEKPTEEPAEEPEPTWTPVPPTATEIPPTEPPAPTPTQIPPPTSTEIPTPTPVPEIATPTPVP